MDEEFIFQVTEEELAQFPEERNQFQEEQSPLEHKQGLKNRGQGKSEIHRKTIQRGQQGKDTFIIRS